VGEFHLVAALVVLGAAAIVTVAAGGAAIIDRGQAAVTGMARAFAGLAVAQGAIGVILFATGRAPGETLHLLYGLALAAVMPLALNFAEDVPGRPHSAVIAVAGVAALLICWRLFATG
jgi:hypothetical protein